MFDVAEHLSGLRERSNQELEHAYAQLDALEAATRTHRLFVLAILDERDVGREDGCVDTAAWVSATSRIGRSSARELTETARRLPALPAVAGVAVDGVLSWEQLEPLVRLATAENDAEWADEAPGWSAAALARSARTPKLVTTEEALERYRQRSFRWWWDQSNGMLRLSGRLADADGATVVQVLERVAFDTGPRPDGLRDPFESRCADALVEMASRDLAEVAEPARACVVVHVPADALAKNADVGGGEVEAGEIALANETARRLACDATWQLIAERPNGVIAGVGRRSRKVPPWMLRQLRRRDRTCRFPGCDRTRGLHAHHIVHWADGGPTDLDNLVLLCSRHHRYLHEHGWSIGGSPADPRGPTFRRPDGEVFRRRRVPLEPEVHARLLETG